MKRAAVLQSHVGGQPNIDIRGNVAIIFLQNPPVNALSYSLRTSILASFEQAEQSPEVQVIVVIGKGRAFSAGADITEFGSEMKPPLLPEVIDRIEGSKKVVVAAVNGLALGGGCELALGCHYRVASNAASFGLPEVKLGLIPGAGGTQRLPRLIGPQNAIQVACTGKAVKAAAALKMGLVDLIAERDLIDAAGKFGLEIVAKKTPIRRLCDDASKLGNMVGNKFLFRAAKQQVEKAAPPGVIAPIKALEAIQAATQASSFKTGLEAERRIFMECAQSPQAAAMQHLFFAERAALRIPGVPADVPPPKLRKVGVVGGGTMGGGIAMNFLKVGIPVIILETSPERRDFAIKTISDNYKVSISRKRLTEEAYQKLMSLLTVVVNDYAQFQDVDYVIEAVFENMKLKKDIFAKLDQVCKPSCILASNTSTLSIDEIASATRRPNKVIGAHFFSPANVMPLLEFVRGRATDGETMAHSLEVGKIIKKKPVMVGNCFGFVSNRMMLKAGFQALCMLEEGAFPRDVDAVIKGFGFPMGIFTMQDLAGLDVGSKIRHETPKELIPNRDVSQIAEDLVKQGRFGQKTGKGWYTYAKENPRTPLPDPDVEKAIIATSKQKKITRRQLSKDEILERYMYSLVNEAAYILQEGFAFRPSDIDIVFIFGFGFPPYRGGPCHYADHIGLPKVVAAIQKYNKALGNDTFPAPCPLLVDLAKSGKKFGDLNRKK